jgi:hypothetical protein
MKSGENAFALMAILAFGIVGWAQAQKVVKSVNLPKTVQTHRADGTVRPAIIPKLVEKLPAVNLPVKKAL